MLQPRQRVGCVDSVRHAHVTETLSRDGTALRQMGQTLPCVASDILMQALQNLWLHGVTTGSVRSSQQIGQRTASVRSSSAAAVWLRVAIFFQRWSWSVRAAMRFSVHDGWTARLAT